MSEAVKRNSHLGTVAGQPQCSGVGVVVCVYTRVHKVKWSILVCSFVSAAAINEFSGQTVLALSVELP